jgi:hypothetical protein
MLSSIRRSALHAAKARAAVSAVSVKSRSLIQPSGADRASVVDVPSSYQDDNLFSPRAGPFIPVDTFKDYAYDFYFCARHARLQARDATQRRVIKR